MILIISFSAPLRMMLTQASSSSPTNASLTEWTVPTPASVPLGLALDSSGKCCWFAEYSGNKLGYLDPTTGTLQEWEIPTQNARPFSLSVTQISGSTAVWGTEFGADRVFVFYPASGIFREYHLPGSELGIRSISVEPLGASVRVWLTESFNNANGEFIYDPNTGNVTFYEDKFPAEVGGGAYGVYAGSGSVWYAGFSALVRWDRASQQYTIWQLPVHGSASGRSIAVDKYGQLWYTQGVSDGISNDNFVGVLRENSTFQEWRIGSEGADPGAVSINPLTQQPWIAEQSSAVGNGTISNLSPFGGSLVTASIVTESSGATVTVLAPRLSVAVASSQIVVPTTNLISASLSGPFTDYGLGSAQPREAIVDSSGNIWTTEPGTNKIARLSPGPDFALTLTPPAVSSPQGGTELVTITGTSISGYSGDVSLSITSLKRAVTTSESQPNTLKISSAETASSTFTIDIGANASVGTTKSITVQGSDGNIVHMISLILTVTNSTFLGSSGPKCFIATATYGSELSPEVRLLRDFRDNMIAKTKIGSSFLIVFNAWYYSFSPYVANYLTTHVIARTVMKGALYPLVGFLFIASRLFTELSAYPELATTASGLLASALIGAFYVGLPLSLLTRRVCLRGLGPRSLSALLLGGIVAVVIGLILSSVVLLMISSSVTVLVTVLTSATLTASSLSRLKKWAASS